MGGEEGGGNERRAWEGTVRVGAGAEPDAVREQQLKRTQSASGS